MRDLFLKTLRLSDELGTVHSYDYYITIDEMDVGRFACESYGVKIVDRDGGGTAAVPHVTCSQERIDELCQLVVDNGVTPVTLRDVVADWL